MSAPRTAVILPTFNRSPYHPSSAEAPQNPLLWTLESFLSLEDSYVSQIIIVDDASTDFTRELVHSIISRPNLRYPIEYRQLGGLRSSARARNYGANLARTEYLLFTDDDCIFPPQALRNTVSILNWLEEGGRNPSALNLPYYIRSVKPKELLPMEEIGFVDFKAGIIRGNFDTFPLEFSAQEPPAGLCSPIRLTQPIEVQNLGCTFLIRKDDFVAVGSFPGDLWWNNSYGEETELATRLIEAGKKIYFAPDPSCCVIHMKYGAVMETKAAERVEQPFRIQLLGKQYDLREITRWSNRETQDSGNRVDLSYWAYSRILSYFYIISQRSLEGGVLWLKRSYRDLVLRDQGSAPLSKFSGREREVIWRAAVDSGIEFLSRNRLVDDNGLSVLKKELLCSIDTEKF